MVRNWTLILLLLLLIPFSNTFADFNEIYEPTNNGYCGEPLYCYEDIPGDYVVIKFDVDRYPHREITSKIFNVWLSEGGCELSPFIFSGGEDDFVDGLNQKPWSNDSHGVQNYSIRAFWGGVYGGTSFILCSPTPYLSVTYGDFYESPQNLRANAGVNEVSLQWNAISENVTYNIYWARSSGVSKNSYEGKISNLSGIYFVHMGLTNGQTYYYRISAQDDHGESPLSAEKNATPVQQDACYPLPSSGNWVVNSDCTLYGDYSAPANVEVKDGAVLTIPDGVTLDIDLVNYNLTVRDGSGVLIKQGGKIE